MTRKLLALKVWLLLLVLFTRGLGLAGYAKEIRGDRHVDRLFPSVSLRRGGLCAYDSARARLVRYGGTVIKGGFPLTSEWDGSCWWPIDTQNAPPVLEGFAMAYDAARGQVVLFGGSPVTDQTWLYDGTDWTLATPAQSPPARTRHQMVYDSVRQRIVLFGGSSDPASVSDLGDTWEWDGSNWHNMTPVSSPSPRFNPQMVYDAQRRVTVLFRGSRSFVNLFGKIQVQSIADMWEYNGSAWSSNVVVNLPAGTEKGPLAYNPGSGMVELFSAFTQNKSFKLWTYDKGTWTSKTYSSSPPAGGNDIHYIDDGNAVYVMHEASSAGSVTTWNWSGSKWVNHTFVHTGSRPTTWADINGDGRLDLITSGDPSVGKTTSSGMAVFLHDGTNLAQNPVWVRDESGLVWSVTAGDVTGDGQPDVAFGFQPNVVAKLIELYANIGGTLSSTSIWQSSTNWIVADLVLTDVDGDGDIDLTALAAESTTNSWSVLVFQNTNGVLAKDPVVAYTLPVSGSGVSFSGGSMVWADINNDGTRECAVAYQYSWSSPVTEVLGWSGSGLISLLSLEGIRAPLAFADVNVDGYPDLIATRHNVGLAIFPNVTGVIASEPSWQASPFRGVFGVVSLQSLAVGDFDGDGDPDIVMLSPAGHALYVNSSGRFKDYPDWVAHVDAGVDNNLGGQSDLFDFDGDGVLDIVAGKGVYLMDRIVRNGFPPLPPRYAMATSGTPNPTDVTITWDASPSDGVASYRIWGRDHRFVGEVPASQRYIVDSRGLATGSSSYYVYAIDEAGNIGGRCIANQIAALPGLPVKGDGKPDYSFSGSLLIGDVTGNLYPDVFTRNSIESEVNRDSLWALWANENGGGFSKVWERRWDAGVPLPGGPVLLKDATGDGRADLLMSSRRPMDLGDGTNVLCTVYELWPLTVSGLANEPLYTIPIPVTSSESIGRRDVTGLRVDWGDVDGDGYFDLAVVGYGPDRKAALFRNDAGVFSSTPIWTSVASNILTLAFGDLNGDGRADLAIVEDRHYGGNDSPDSFYVYLGSATGLGASPFWSQVNVSGASQNNNITGVEWRDFDGNGSLDLTFFGWGATYGYRNTGGVLPKTYSFAVTQSGTIGSKPAHNLRGWADVDGNGIMDLYSATTVIQDAGLFAGMKNDTNLATWESQVTSGANKFISAPWFWGSDNLISAFADFDRDGIDDMVCNRGEGMIFLGSSVFPPASTVYIVNKLIVSPSSPIILNELGRMQALTVLAEMKDGSTLDVTDQAAFQFESADDQSNVITISNNVITAKSPGQATLEVSWGDSGAGRVKYVVSVEASPVIPVSLRVTPGDATLTREGEVLRFTVVATMAGGQVVDVTNEATLQSDRPAVCSVTGTVGLAGQNGIAQISAHYAGLTATSTVTVSRSVAVTSLELMPSATTIAAGGHQSFGVIAHYSDGTIADVTFQSTISSSAPGTAAIAGFGVNGLAPGMAVVTATYHGISGTSTVRVDDFGSTQMEVLDFSINAGSAYLRWYCSTPSGSTARFTIYACTNLVEGIWVPVVSNLVRQPLGFNMFVMEPETNAATVFYRVGLE